MQLTIDGKKVIAKEGETLLQVARRNGIDIPSQCYHDAIEPRGSCRLCMVEISRPDKWPGWKRLVTSCVYPVEEGLTVKTNTEEVQEIRRTLLELLLSRTPNNPHMKAYAKKMGVTETEFVAKNPEEQCILCGQCVRVCDEVIGAHAIDMYDRGATKKVGPAYGEAAEDCIGCGACAHVCPTKCIEVIDAGMTRKIPRWNVEFELVPCRVCGRPVSTREHIEFVRQRVNVGPEVLETCSECLGKFYATKVAAEGHM